MGCNPGRGIHDKGYTIYNSSGGERRGGGSPGGSIVSMS